jgi:hypothetical protein
MAPEQRRRRTLEALRLQMETLSRSNPVLMIVEDAHWTDPTSLEPFGRAVDRIKSLRVLLIVTFRPEFEPPWIGRPYVTALTITISAIGASSFSSWPCVVQADKRNAGREQQLRAKAAANGN